ncbi:MAG: hypothetical protein HY234_00050 [Acidobacteria bacterium]|nr:hypothetical protein [Acidobacteriota bacterium]
MTDVQRPDGEHVTYAYSDTAKTVTVSTPVQGTDRVVQKTYFDALGRAFKQEVKNGDQSQTYSIVEARFDPLGRTYKQSNPYTGTAQYWTESRLDALGRVKTVIAPDNSQTTYAYSGSTVTATDPTGKQRKSESDALGRLIKVSEPDVNNPADLSQHTTYAYSVLDALVTVTQGAQTRTYNYDDLGRLLNQTTPEAGTWSYTYNEFNQVVTRTDARGVVTTYTYDTLNRIRTVSYNVGSTGVPATPSVTYNYGTGEVANNIGRLYTVTDGVGSEGYTYDLLGRATQLQKVINSTTYTTQYAYNLAGELTAITYPSGRVVQQSFDTVGRLSSIASGGSNFADTIGYNTAGQVTGFNYGNGVAASFGYSADRLQLTSLSYVKNTTTLLNLGYNYGAAGSNNGQILGITDSTGTQEAGRSVTYTYDALYRLKTAVTTGSTSYPQWGLSWTYDRYGNRTSQSILSGCQSPLVCPTNSVTIDPTTNRMTDQGYGYDANGNMTNDGQNAMAYDGGNRLVSSTTNGNTVTYSPDGAGLRVKKVNGTTNTVYVFSGSKVIAEYEYQTGSTPSAASPTREYMYSGSQLLAKIEAGSTRYYHPDLLSNRAISDGTPGSPTFGQKISESGHYPFGENWYETGGTNKLKFTTYERDAESGNDYVIFRSYVNRLGRFSSPDPIAGSIADPQSLNRYAYVLNDPCNLFDPLGLQCKVTVATDQTKLNDKQKTAMKDELEKIFKDAGVDVIVETSDTPDYSLAVVPNAPSNSGKGLPEAAAGITFTDVVTGELLPRGSVFIDRLEQSAGHDPSFGQNSQNIGVALGRAGAHEVGHYLLGMRGHSIDGVMRSKFDGKEWFMQPPLIHPDTWSFTDKQIAALRTRCGRAKQALGGSGSSLGDTASWWTMLWFNLVGNQSAASFGSIGNGTRRILVEVVTHRIIVPKKTP